MYTSYTDYIKEIYICIWLSLLYICLHVGSHLLADTRGKEDDNLSIQIAVLISVRQNSKCLFGRNSCTSTFLKYQLWLFGTGYHNGNSFTQKNHSYFTELNPSLAFKGTIILFSLVFLRKMLVVCLNQNWESTSLLKSQNLNISKRNGI